MESAYVFYGSLYNARDKIVEEPSILLDPEVDAFLGWGERAAMQAEQVRCNQAGLDLMVVELSSLPKEMASDAWRNTPLLDLCSSSVSIKTTLMPWNGSAGRCRESLSLPRKHGKLDSLQSMRSRHPSLGRSPNYGPFFCIESSRLTKRKK